MADTTKKAKRLPHATRKHTLTKREISSNQTRNYLGETLKELRDEKGLSQAEAAKKCEISQGQWSSYENGNTKPSLDIVLQIAKALDTHALAIIGKSIEKSKMIDSFLELSFDDYKEILGGIENFRKDKVQDRLMSLS